MLVREDTGHSGSLGPEKAAAKWLESGVAAKQLPFMPTLSAPPHRVGVPQKACYTGRQSRRLALLGCRMTCAEERARTLARKRWTQQEVPSTPLHRQPGKQEASTLLVSSSTWPDGPFPVLWDQDVGNWGQTGPEVDSPMTPMPGLSSHKPNSPCGLEPSQAPTAQLTGPRFPCCAAHTTPVSYTSHTFTHLGASVVPLRTLTRATGASPTPGTWQGGLARSQFWRLSSSSP